MSMPIVEQNGGILPPGAAPNQGIVGLETIPDSRVLQRYDDLEAAKGNAQFVYAAIPGPNVATIYRPGMPIRMVSALDPTALKEGEFSLLQNVRPDNDVISARYPTTLFGSVATTFSPALPGGTLARGVWSGTLNGSQYVVTAWFDGTAVRLYSSTDGHSFGEVTSTSSAYGYTGQNSSSRFPDSGSNCAFQSLTNTSPTGVSTDYLVVQNGTSNPMLYSTSALNSAHVFPIAAVGAPTGFETVTAQASVGSYWNFSSWTLTPAYTGNLTLSGPTNGAYIFSYSSPYVAGNFCTLTTPGGTDYLSTASAAQLCVLLAYTDGYDSMVYNCAFEVYDNASSTWYCLYNPAGNSVGLSSGAPAGTGAPPYISATDPVLLYGPSEVLVYSSSMLATANGGAGMQITALKWTVPTGAVAATNNGAAAIYGLYAGGGFSSDASLAVSFENSGTQVESPAVIMLPSTRTPSFSSIGVNGYFTGSLPEDENLFYNLSFLTQSSSQASAGVDTLNLYVSLPGSTTYGYLSSTSISSYSGTWSSRSAQLVTVGTAGTYTTVVAGGQPVDTYTSPDAYITQMPRGSCMAGGGGRSFVGTASQYWFSEYLFPFRYRLVLDVESGVVRSSSGGYVSLPNTEHCAQWAVAGASALGTNNLFLFTDKSIYNVQGADGLSLSQPSLLASVGCSAPDSVALYRDSIFFVDDNYQIVKFSYGQSQFYFYQNVNSYQLLMPLSKRVVDDQTRGIPASRLGNGVGCAVYDRYYLAYTPSGGTKNSRMLVFDMTIGSFVLDTPGISAMTAEALCPCLIGGRSVYCQSSDLQCYEWENTGSTAPVSASVVSSAMNPGGFAKTFFGRVGVVADAQGAGSSLAISKSLIAGGNAYGSGNSDSSSISLDPSTVSGGQVFRWDSKVLADGSTGPAGMAGLTCQLSLGPVSLVPGSRLLAIVQEQQAAAPGADAL